MERIAALIVSGLVAMASVSSIPTSADEATRPNPRGLIERTVLAMGGGAPSSSEAQGSIDIVEGSLSDRGTIRILTRGLQTSKEAVELGGRQEETIYSDGRAAQRDGDIVRPLQKELVVSSMTSAFPLWLLSGVLADPDHAFQYVGEETVDGRSCWRVRFWHTFDSEPSLADVAPVSAKEVWIESRSALPIQLAYQRLAARGANVGIPLVVAYSDYRDVGGIKFPFAIERSFNGTHWSSIRIERVSVGLDLSTESFNVE